MSDDLYGGLCDSPGTSEEPPREVREVRADGGARS